MESLTQAPLPTTKISVSRSLVKNKNTENYNVSDLFLAASYRPKNLYVPEKIRSQVRFLTQENFCIFDLPTNRKPVQQKKLIHGVKRFLALKLKKNTSKKQALEVIQAQASYKNELNSLRSQSEGLVTHFGSHRGNTPAQLEYVQNIAYQNARQNNYGVVTGGGSGMMFAPLAGVNQFNEEADQYLPQIGISEPNLLIHEPPNNLVQDFFVYPDIDIRKAGMIEAGDTLVTHEGGVGTIEELIQTLLVLLDPKNKNKPYKIHLIYSEKKYFEAMKKLLRAINIPLELLKDRLTFSFQPTPEIVAQNIKKSVEAVLVLKHEVFKNKPTYLEYPDSAFNENSDKINDYKTTIASVNFMSDNPLKNLQQTKKLMGILIDLTAKYKDIVPTWSTNDYPIIYGKEPMITAVENLLDLMVKQNRMKYPTKTGTPFFSFQVVN
jgi:predicted Rossmann-fold nucleotide-binding protein